MAIAVDNHVRTDTTSASTSISSAFPSGWAEDHLGVAIVHMDDTEPSSTPSGWTLVASGNNANKASVGIFYRILQSGDSAPTFTVASADTGHVDMLTISDYDAADISEGSSVRSTTAVDFDANNVTRADTPTLGLFAATIDNGGTSPPYTITDNQSGWTLITPSSGGDTHSGTGYESWSDYKRETTANAEGNRDIARDGGASGGTRSYIVSWWINEGTDGPSGGTTFEESFASTTTLSGALDNLIGKPVAGTTTLSGALASLVGKPVAGSVTVSGDLTNLTGKPLAGSTTVSGAFRRQPGKALAGTATTSGSTVTKEAQKPLAGTATLSGAVAKLVGKSAFSGTVTTSGAFSSIKAILRSFAGTVTTSGAAIVRQVGKALAGTATVSGARTQQTSKDLAGTTTVSGVLDQIKAVLRSFAGTATTSGALTRQPGKALSGTATTSGSTVTKVISKALAATATVSGALVRLVGLILTAATVTVSGAFSETTTVISTAVAAWRKIVVAAEVRTIKVLSEVRSFLVRQDDE